MLISTILDVIWLSECPDSPSGLHSLVRWLFFCAGTQTVRPFFVSVMRCHEHIDSHQDLLNPPTVDSSLSHDLLYEQGCVAAEATIRRSHYGVIDEPLRIMSFFVSMQRPKEEPLSGTSSQAPGGGQSRVASSTKASQHIVGTYIETCVCRISYIGVSMWDFHFSQLSLPESFQSRDVDIQNGLQQLCFPNVSLMAVSLRLFADFLFVSLAPSRRLLTSWYPTYDSLKGTFSPFHLRSCSSLCLTASAGPVCLGCASSAKGLSKKAQNHPV